MKWFKTEKEKEQELQAELIHLRTKYAEEIDCYCKIGDWIFILKGFKILTDKILVLFRDKDTLEGYNDCVTLTSFQLKYDNMNFKKARYEFVKFHQNLKKIGLKLEKT